MNDAADVRVPASFVDAFLGLEQLVERLLSGEVRGDGVGREAIRWMWEDALGSLALCKAAIFSMRHEAASGGLAADAETARATVRALGVVERAVDPPENPHSPLVPTPARAPEALKRRAPDARVFRLGKAQILAEPGGAAGWHISVSHPERFPYFEELMAACGVTGDTDKRFAALIPAATASSEGSGFLVHLVEAVAGGTEGFGA